MSFALNYRKKLQQKVREEQAFRKANEGFVTLPLGPDSDTRGNRRRVFFALLIAGGFLAVLNSAGLVNYAYGLADSRIGRSVIAASERWHEMMQDRQATRVVDHIRGSVAAIRETRWQDLKIVFGSDPGVPVQTGPEQSPVLPASVPPMPIAPELPEPKEPVKVKPAGPVLRAAADGLTDQTH